MVSINRVQNILQQQIHFSLKERRESSNQMMLEVTGLTSCRRNASNILVPVINNVTFSLQKGTIMSIIGSVGAGKTSLLLSLASELELIAGKFNLPGSCVFVPQEPWILPISVRENITYGRKWDLEWYNKVVFACCLLIDFDQLAERDFTVVGERGITLSGGQKARIGLARAVYANADIYLLDDPLSSVDVAVAEKLFNIIKHGVLAKKTVLLATHQLQFVSRTDQVLLLEGGQVLACGTYQNIAGLPRFENSKLLHTQHPTEKDADLVMKNIESSLELKPRELNTTPVETRDGMNEEVVHYSSISVMTYAKYFWAGSNFTGIICLIFLGSLSYFGVFVLMDYYLALWVMADQIKQNNLTTLTTSFNPLVSQPIEKQIIFLIGFCFILCFFLFVSSPLETCVPVLSSYRLHTRMLWSVLRGTSRFFSTHSSGSIINRFSRDISIMDFLLPHYFHRLFLYSNILVLTMLSAAITHWLTLVPSIILLGILFLYRLHLVRIIRQIKRLESAARSDVILHISLTLHGLTSIHSLKLESHQFHKLCAYENIHSKCWRIFVGYVRWFSFQVNCIIAIYALSIALVLILLRDQISPATSAFALSQLFRLFDTSQILLRASAEVEMNMVSVERVFDFINIPQEAPLHSTAKSTRNKPFLTGAIEFEKVCLRYYFHLPLVLKDVSFRVEGGEKLGIVGRTGAGKSSLQTALLRLVELESGCITIDGMDIRELGLHELRGQISIIPQDPILFSGPLRFALDPFSVFQDEQLWQALEEVRLKGKVQALEGRLDYCVSEGGSNFSVGEKQLFCLARAVLKQTKILMLDEATSNVDTLTDSRIQQIVHFKFRECTVLTIAHRLHTVMNYDRIMLMDDGRIVECGTPNNLLADPCSKFAQLFAKMKVA